MEHLSVSETQTKVSIHPATRVGSVHYTVADLNKQVAFYQNILGFSLLWQEGGSAALGAGQHELLRLTELSGARRVRRTTGLYHTAFLVPTRWELAHLMRQIAQTHTPIQGTSNHGTHLAIYLPDAEGNGIELAWDFPKESWPMKDGKISFELMPRTGVDIEDLLGELERDPSPWVGLDARAQIGHIHLHVSDLETSQQFYYAVLGFDIVMKSQDFGALFVSAGGYHHHIGMNIWNGVGAPPSPADATGLRYFSIDLPSESELQRIIERVRQAKILMQPVKEGILLRDPSNNGVVLRVVN